MQESEKYKLVGVINQYGVVPEFVYPVFEQDGNYYIQDGADDFTIDCFELLTDEKSIKSIKPLNDFSVIYAEKKITFTIGENKLLGFDFGRNYLFLGDYNAFKHYVGNINMSDEFMKIEIPYYIETNDKLLLEKQKKN